MQAGGTGGTRQGEHVVFTDGDNRDVEVRGGVTVWRGEVLSEYSRGGVSRSFTHAHPQRRGFFLRGRRRRRCALGFAYAVDGWRTEPSVSTPAAGQSEQETVVIFTVFQGCLQCRSLRGANQNVKNKDTTCQSFRLRAGFYFLCAKGALTLSSMPEHTLTHPHYGCLAHSRVKRPHWHPRFKSTSTRPGPSPLAPRPVPLPPPTPRLLFASLCAARLSPHHSCLPV